MSVIQGKKSEGLEYIQNDKEYTYENMDCIVNQKQTHSNGTLYLTKE